MTKLPPELRQAIAEVGGQPLRIEDPETHEVYVVLKEDRFQRLQAGLDYEAGPLTVEETELAYSAIDESFREGWDTPQMDEYDDYEANRR